MTLEPEPRFGMPRDVMPSRGRPAPSRFPSSLAVLMAIARADEPVDLRRPEQAASRFPTVRPEHRHVRDLLANAMRYVAPENRMVDPVSGYPFEGWNQDPSQGLFLRSFTQLTAIGQYMELLANVVAGECRHARTSRGSRPWTT